MAVAALEGQAGIITGGGSGIGAATAAELAALGARLVVSDLSGEKAAGTVKDIHDSGHEADAIAANVTVFDDLVAVRDRCLAAYGRIDFAVANAGIVDASSLADGDPERWRQVIETNVLGAAYTIRAVLGAMRQHGSGHIVLIASLSGRNAYVGEPIYIASKWAVVGLGHALEKEAIAYGVRVTLIEPGLVDTPMTRANPFSRKELDTADAPLQPVDVARAVAFALSQPPHVSISELAIRPMIQAS